MTAQEMLLDQIKEAHSKVVPAYNQGDEEQGFQLGRIYHSLCSLYNAMYLPKDEDIRTIFVI